MNDFGDGKPPWWWRPRDKKAWRRHTALVAAKATGDKEAAARIWAEIHAERKRSGIYDL